MNGYECDECGACCQGHLIVEADELDLLREPRLVQADPYWRGSSYEDVLSALGDEMGKCIVLAAARPCSFLTPENRCGIYPTRPNECVAMPAGDEQCQLARQAAGLLPLEPVDESNPGSPQRDDSPAGSRD